MDPSLLAQLPVFFVVAALYSSVGHGGATGYLAAMSIYCWPQNTMASTSLVLNCVTSGIACYAFARKGFLPFKLALPFILASVPAAYIGSQVPISEQLFSILLAVALIAAAIRLAWITPEGADTELKPVHTPLAALTGGLLGLFSGAIGIGGGVFLSPLLIFLRWADPKQTAAISAFFILVNSISGIVGRVNSSRFAVNDVTPFLMAAISGALLGSWAGCSKFSGPTLRRVLAAVLIVAVAKMMIQSGT